MKAPVIVGTSVLAPAAKAPALSSFKVPTPPKVDSGLAELLGGTAPSASTSSPIGSLADIIAAATGATAKTAKSSNQAFGALPDSNVADTYAQLTSGANPKSGSGLSTSAAFGAALKLAAKEMGGFDASPYNIAAGAASNSASTAKAEAAKNAAQAEADDAALYGRLGNFVADTEHAGNKDTRQTGKAINQNYGSEADQLNQIFGGVDSSSAAAMRRLGLDPGVSTSVGAEDQQFLKGETANNKANAKSNNRSSGNAFDQLMQETKGDTRATGSADVASQKSGLNATLASIAQSLDSQLASVNESKATARSSYESQLRQAAASLLSQQEANDPSTLANQLKASELASNEASTLEKERALQQGPSTAGEDPFTKALAAIQAASPNLAPGRAAIATDWLKRAEVGDLGSHTPQSGWTGVNAKDLPNILQNLQKVYSQHPGFGVPAQNVLEQAIHILAGK